MDTESSTANLDEGWGATQESQGRGSMVEDSLAARIVNDE